MLKLIFCVRRRSDMSIEEFRRYWHDEHGPLVKKHAAALGIARYVQVHTEQGALSEAVRAQRGGPEAYDGVAELWFDEAVLADPGLAAEREAAAAALLEDERRFIQLDASPVFFARERPIID